MMFMDICWNLLLLVIRFSNIRILWILLRLVYLLVFWFCWFLKWFWFWLCWIFCVVCFWLWKFWICFLSINIGRWKRSCGCGWCCFRMNWFCWSKECVWLFVSWKFCILRLKIRMSCCRSRLLLLSGFGFFWSVWLIVFICLLLFSDWMVLLLCVMFVLRMSLSVWLLIFLNCLFVMIVVSCFGSVFVYWWNIIVRLFSWMWSLLMIRVCWFIWIGFVLLLRMRRGGIFCWLLGLILFNVSGMKKYWNGWLIMIFWLVLVIVGVFSMICRKFLIFSVVVLLCLLMLIVLSKLMIYMVIWLVIRCWFRLLSCYRWVFVLLILLVVWWVMNLLLYCLKLIRSSWLSCCKSCWYNWVVNWCWMVKGDWWSIVWVWVWCLFLIMVILSRIWLFMLIWLCIRLKRKVVVNGRFLIYWLMIWLIFVVIMIWFYCWNRYWNVMICLNWIFNWFFLLRMRLWVIMRCCFGWKILRVIWCFLMNLFLLLNGWGWFVLWMSGLWIMFWIDWWRSG